MRINARFPGAPETVRFSYLPPQSKDAFHDPGSSVEGTLIQSEGDDLYSFSLDTRQMRGGLGWWYFVSEDPDPSKRRAKVGKFLVRDVPTTLYSPQDEVVVLGTDAAPRTSKAFWPWLAASAAAGAAIGALASHHYATTTDDVISDVVSDAVEENVTRALLPRAADGKFLSASTAPVAIEGEDDAVEDEITNEDDGPDHTWAILGVAAIGALGYWLWRKHRASKTTAMGELSEPIEYDGLDSFGAY